MKTRYALTGTCLLGMLGASAFGDWMPGDPYKMHYPQLPDPMGWDVKVSGNNVVADDFQCIATGPITEIHFWGSWMDDMTGPTPGMLQNIHLSIHANNPTGPNGWSEPIGPAPLWEYNTFEFDPTLVTWREVGLGEQGWFDPIEPPGQGTWVTPDHFGIWQYNVIIDPSMWFIQEAGTIYWLDIHVVTEDPMTEFGWKTSLSPHFMDDAVTEDFFDILPGDDWIELRDPITSDSLDMAFVIVPEPGEYALLLGAIALASLMIRRLRLTGSCL